MGHLLVGDQVSYISNPSVNWVYRSNRSRNIGPVIGETGVVEKIIDESESVLVRFSKPQNTILLGGYGWLTYQGYVELVSLGLVSETNCPKLRTKLGLKL